MCCADVLLEPDETQAMQWETYNRAVWGRLRLDLIRHRVGRLLGKPGCRLLDVGCGTGETSLFAAALGASVTAVDRSPAMLRRVRERADQEGLDILVIERDVSEGLSLPDEPFDVVLCHNVLAYVEDGASLLRGLSSRVAPGGQLSVVVSNAQAEPMRYALERHDLVEALRWAVDEPSTRQGETFDKPMRLHRPAEIRDWIIRSNLEVSLVAGVNVLAPYLPNEFKEEHYAELLALELAIGDQLPYVDIAVHLYVEGSRAPA
jgi:S-adenosylmethionine-dependent methyltransferase